jgi:hypothetical protein
MAGATSSQRLIRQPRSEETRQMAGNEESLT